MKVKTNLKAGAINHSETLVRDKAKGLKLKTHVRAGAINHNETLVRDTAN